MGFCLRISELRKANQYTQEELAEKIGVSRQAVAKWETGESTPDLPKLISLADCFNVSLDRLVGRDDTIFDMIKARLSTYEKLTGKDEDVLPVLHRFVKYGEENGMTAEQVLKGILYLCEENNTES